MLTNLMVCSALPDEMVEQVLTKLGFADYPELTLQGLRAIYARWCRRVPFDNVRKLIHVRAGLAAPLPGSTAADFLGAWLQFGTGGTCWSNAGAFQAFLTSLGFNAARCIATMLVMPELPPNHGSVHVAFGDDRYILDTSILHGEPLHLSDTGETGVAHPAWGVRGAMRDGRWHFQWRPLNRLDGLVVRFERFDASADEYQSFYERTRSWSPFNYELSARLNGEDNVFGLSYGKAVTIQNDGSTVEIPASHAERMRILIEELGIGEELVCQVPEDEPTPPPPFSRTAQSAS